MKIDAIKKIMIYGAGMMGHAIGQAFVQGGYEVVLYGRSEQRLAGAVSKIERNLKELAAGGHFDLKDVTPALSKISISTDLLEAVGHADVVIESVLEDLTLKQTVFSKLDALCPPETILASNTSSIIPSKLAASLNHPERVLVAHFFNPPYLMPLVEVVKGKKTTDEAATAIYMLMKKIGKSPIMVNREVLGFIGNRLQMALFREAAYLVDQGIASPQDVDLAVTESFGRRLPFAGPFRYFEYIDGWEQVLQIEKYLRHNLDNSPGSAKVIQDMVRTNQLGMKSGKGFYNWSPEETEAWRRDYIRNLVRFIGPNSGLDSRK